MQHPPLRRVVSGVAVLAALVAAAAPVRADEQILNGNLVGAGAPFAVTKCVVAHSESFWHGGTVTVVNRTRHQLLAAGVALRMYDAENTLIGQTSVSLPVTTPVASDDVAAYEVGFGVSMTEPISAVARVDCRPANATFTGNKKWTYGQTWPEKLLPLPTARHDAGEGEGTRNTGAVRTKPHVQVAVTRSWTDTLDGVLYVHDALAIVGSEGTVTLRPSDLTLTVPLANGARKTYAGLAQAAPTYQRLNPFGSATTTVPEVAPAEDFGRIGMMTVPPHGAVTTTVTFAIADPVAPDATYREVSLR